MKHCYVLLLIFVLSHTKTREAKVLNYDSVTVCQYENKRIQCPYREKIHILSGFYGKWSNHDCYGALEKRDGLKTCSMERSKSTAIVRDICQGKNFCNLFADNSIYGTLCPDKQKYLYVTYFCMAKGQVLQHHKNSADEIVVTVPSHGHIVGGSITERRHNIGQNIFSQTDSSSYKASLGTFDSINAKLDVRMSPEKSQQSTSTESTVKSKLPDLDEIRKVLDVKDKELRSTLMCNGQSKLIACLPNEAIKIHYAFYGKKSGRDCRGELPYKDESPTCSALDAKNNVQSFCEGKQTCLLFADDNIYGKSLCPSVNKYLYLTYYCSDFTNIGDDKVQFLPKEDLEEDAVSKSGISTINIPRRNMTVQLCNGERRTIGCNTKNVMIVEASFYGKRNGEDCRGKLGYRDDIPNCSNEKALETVKILCEGRRSCELEAEPALFGNDFCPGINKYLVVAYSC